MGEKIGMGGAAESLQLVIGANVPEFYGCDCRGTAAAISSKPGCKLLLEGIRHNFGRLLSNCATGSCLNLLSVAVRVNSRTLSVVYTYGGGGKSQRFVNGCR